MGNKRATHDFVNKLNLEFTTVDTALRPNSELFRLRRANVHLEPSPEGAHGFLHVPDGKTDAACRNVPLTRRERAVLEMRKAAKRGSAFVFPGTGKTGHITTVQHAHERTIKRVNEAARKQNLEKAAIPARPRRRSGTDSQKPVLPGSGTARAARVSRSPAGWRRPGIRAAPVRLVHRAAGRLSHSAKRRRASRCSAKCVKVKYTRTLVSTKTGLPAVIAVKVFSPEGDSRADWTRRKRR